MRNSFNKSYVSKAETAFFRKIAYVGAFLLFGISAMNMFMDTNLIDKPAIRIILACMLLIFCVASYYSKVIQRHGMSIIYSLTTVYIVYAIYITSLNNFDVYDTSTTMIVCFALGALFKSKQYLDIYMAVAMASFIYFLYTCPSPQCSETYVYATMFLMMILAYIVFGGKINAMEQLTKHKQQLEVSETRFRNIFDFSPLGVFLLDENGVPVKANNKLQEMLGYSEEEILTMPIEKYILTEDFISSSTMINRLKESPDNTILLEQRFRTKTGKTIWGRITMALMDSEIGENTFVICMIEDNSFEKEARVQLNEYAAKLKNHNRSLEEFSYVISHDLQEPLRMIRSYSTLIKRKYINHLNDENATLDMDYVIDGATRMSNLIKDMLAYSRWSAKPFEKEEVDSTEVLVEVLKNLTMSIKDNEAIVLAQKLPKVSTNRLLLGQVFQNLVGNGIKYSYKDRKPIIEIKGEKRENDILFTIEDNGQGFNEKDKERIFGIFQRLHGRHSNYTGTGIGLAICKRVIEKQGGAIWAEGVEGEGATFYFTLPLDESN